MEVSDESYTADLIFRLGEPTGNLTHHSTPVNFAPEQARCLITSREPMACHACLSKADGS